MNTEVSFFRQNVAPTTSSEAAGAIEIGDAQVKCRMPDGLTARAATGRTLRALSAGL
jgi:hypothetical protein